MLGILEFLKLEFLASVALLPRNDADNSRIPKLEFPNLELLNIELLNIEFPIEIPSQAGG